MASEREVQIKEERLRGMLDDLGLDAVSLQTTANFAWLTCGGHNHVSIASEVGAAIALVTKDSKYIICDNIEAGRIADEEVADQDYEVVSCNWHENKKEDLMREILGSGTLGSDTPMIGAQMIAGRIDNLRWALTDEEVERYRTLGRLTADGMLAACKAIKQGMTENEAAGILCGALYARGLVPVVTLVASNERISKYRHPLPQDKKIGDYVMLVTGCRKWGLNLSMSRLVHFGRPGDELIKKHIAVTSVDAAFIANTVCGASVGDIFTKGRTAYEQAGYPDEWQLHHQGGPTGYKGREFRATSESKQEVVTNQAFAWNPSITGTKSEDTIIATENGPEIISDISGWPKIEVEIEGRTIKRPDILAR